MAADNEKKALALIADCEKKLKASQGFFTNLLGGGVKIEDVCENYTKAANLFKMAKNWNAAGSAFCQAAALHLKNDRAHDGATCYVDAGTCYKKTDAQEAVNCMMKAVDIYTDMGKFTLAAKHHMTIAEIYEGEINDLGKAVEQFEKAADYFKGEEAGTSANRCLLKVAQYAAQLEKYDRAIEIYEQVGTESLNNTLLKHCAKDHFFRAAICHLCVDTLNLEHALAKYEEMMPAFKDSRECKLMKQLGHLVEEQNVEGFTETIKEYDSITRFEPWFTTLFLRIKKTISDEDLC